jgi:hypothetical protein
MRAHGRDVGEPQELIMTTGTTSSIIRGVGADQRGNVLVLGISLVVVMLGLSTAYIHVSIGESQHARVAGERSQAFYVAEAGVNRAIVDIAAGGTGILGTSASPVEFGGGALWTVVGSGSGGGTVVTATGRIGEQEASIEVVAVLGSSSNFTKALFGDRTVDATGQVFTDSYDSDLGTYASQATNVHKITGSTYAGTDGSLGSNGDIDLAGQSTILGDVTPGPTSSVSISGGHVHVEGSTASSKCKTTLPPVEYTPTIASSGLLKKGATLGTGTYRYDEVKLASKSVLEITGDAVIYVDGNISLSGQSRVIVRAGASLTIYQDEADCKFTGQGLVNESVKPASLQLYTKAKSVMFSGQAFFIGVLYAPEAAIKLSGQADVFGSFVAETVAAHGQASFHHDEALCRADSGSSENEIQIVSWRRVSSPGK